MKGFGRMLYMQLTYQPKPLPENIDLSNQTALVTGANGGLGLEAARDLASRKVARLITVDYEDYNSLVDLSKRAAALDRLHVVILDAGVRQIEYKATATGHEQNLQVNHIGTSILSLSLIPILEQTAKQENKPTRLTIVTSVVHWMDEKESMEIGAPHDHYGTSKLLNILWMRQLATKVDPDLTVVNAVDPGLCKSNLHRYETRLPINIVSSIFSWTAAQGGHNIANAAVAQESSSHGAYVSSEQVVKEPSDFVVSTKGKDAQERVWEETIALIRKDVPSLSLPAFT